MSVKALYHSLHHSEAPLLKDQTTSLLSEVYEYLGNDKEAAEWRSRTQEYQPLVSVEDLFYRRIRTATAFPVLEEEIVRLDKAMTQMIQQTADEILQDRRGLVVLNMCTIADEYLNQYELLGIEVTRQLLHRCFHHIEMVLSRIDIESRQSCTGQILQTKARLLSTEAALGLPILEELVRLRKKLVVAYEKALQYYQRVNKPLAAGFISSHLAICHKGLWTLTGKSPDSPSFRKGIKLFDNARAILKQHRLIDPYQRCIYYGLDMWFENYKAKLHQPPTVWEV